MYAVVFHAHQKIDRVAHKHLERIIGERDEFPRLRKILHFEGRNGPDAIKLKNKTDVERPWHFMNPFDAHDEELDGAITHHYNQLVAALRENNQERAAFEAAWLAHALVDGLTPAHHYPYEEELADLRGAARDTRSTIREHLLVKGETAGDSLRRSFKLVGPKGLLTMHTAFEAGAFMIMAPMKLTAAFPHAEDLERVRSLGLVEYFHRTAREIGAQGMFEQFCKTGWTPKLARKVRKELAPRMVATVTLAWYSALVDAGVVKAEPTAQALQS